MVVVNLARELIAMKYLPLFTEQIKCKCFSKTLEYAFNCSVSTKSWLSHTLCIPRNETQRKCSIFVNIDCVFSRLYCALIFLCLYIFFGCWYTMEVKTICYVVQYAVHMELCSTNLFSGFLVVYWYFFSIKVYWRCQVESILLLDNNITQDHLL